MLSVDEAFAAILAAVETSAPVSTALPMRWA